MITPKAQSILGMVQKDALKKQMNEICAENILAAVLEEGTSAAFRALVLAGLSPTSKKELGESADANIRLPSTDAIVQAAKAEASLLRHDYVGPEHLLLAIATASEEPLWEKNNTSSATVRKLLLRLLGSPKNPDSIS